MTNQDTREHQVKSVIEALIQTATSYDLDTLDSIYHDELHVVMVDTSDNVSTADKNVFKGILQAKREAGNPPMNTWAKYHRIEVKGDTANVLLSRKNDLSGQPMILFLSIDLVHEDDRWQVLREVVFLRPDNELSDTTA